jgi:hypothetical protein
MPKAEQDSQEGKSQHNTLSILKCPTKIRNYEVLRLSISRMSGLSSAKRGQSYLILEVLLCPQVRAPAESRYSICSDRNVDTLDIGNNNIVILCIVPT